MKTRPLPGTPRRPVFRRLLLACIVVTVLLGGAALVARRLLPGSSDALHELSLMLARDLPASRAIDDIPANTWVKLYQPWHADWRRQAHAGAAYDSKRGTLMLFGSNTHGMNWDNRIHIFDPDRRAWTSPYPESSPDTYRLDEQGRAIAGDDVPRPWAMHTFDTVLYDAGRDALVIAARPEHNPKRKEFGNRAQYLSWTYDLAGHEWRFLDSNEAKATPHFFGMSGGYDSLRDTLVVYGGGVWEMGPDREHWLQATHEVHHDIHHSMVFDAVRGLFAVFGNYKPTTSVWLYLPGARPGDKGIWEERHPSGDVPPAGQTLPAAYDSKQQLFLVVVDRPVPRGQHGGAADTYVYDLDANRYRRLPMATIDAVGMNYDMVYDSRRGVFLLVTGDWRSPPIVWALRLNPRLLRD